MSRCLKRKLQKLVPSRNSSQFKPQKFVPTNLKNLPIHKIKFHENFMQLHSVLKCYQIALATQKRRERRNLRSYFYSMIQSINKILWGQMPWDKTPCTLWNHAYDKNSVGSRYCRVWPKIIFVFLHCKDYDVIVR